MTAPFYEDPFEVTAQVVSIGTINLPSGWITACDPFFCSDALAYSRSVTPGRYDVQLRLMQRGDWGRRVALARLVINSKAKAVTFLPADTAAATAATYLVDSGLSSFMDEMTRRAFARTLITFQELHPRGNYYTDVLAPEVRDQSGCSLPGGGTGDWAIHHLPESDLNIAIFATGLGDGEYRSFWGVDDKGGLTSLITDFGIL